MARKPRPIDPAEGPLQAFAYDLRKVREAAGNPTYRALAGLAGFSATTLSDAAGGVRLPSLEVTLAYVGACGGDERRWQDRWQELDRSLASERGALTAVEPTSGAPTATGSTSGGPTVAPGSEPLPTSQEDSVAAAYELDELDELDEQAAEIASLTDGGGPTPPPGRRRWWWSQWTAVGAVIVLTAACGLLAFRLSAASKSAAAPPCPARANTPGTFTGLTYSGSTRVRSGASVNAPVIAQIPAGCTLEFTGFCLGDVVGDPTAGTPDMRWLEVRGGGLVASAVIHGNPPSAMQPTPCANDVPTPSSISLTVAPQGVGSDMVELRATGSHVGIAGFAAYYTTGGGASAAPQWHQVGLTSTTTADFGVPWRLGPLQGAPLDQGAIPVVAVACFGGNGPTGVVSAKLLRPGPPATTQPAELDAGALAAGELAACGYPRLG